jgi:sulfate adenylyltransferase subunit 1
MRDSVLLTRRRKMDVLRIATAGSVDDGKSTLIGRLLYETHSITSDRLEAIEKASARKGIGFLDLSLLTDGLMAEREQGITIDVAHIYFNTPKRKFIIADSPGHVEYTRNMITGASKAEVSIILLDARHGLVEQTHRHYFIANLLRTPYVFVCINKMDLVDYREETFQTIRASFQALASRLPNQQQQIMFIPICSLHGDNLTRLSSRMPWYEGKPLLSLLEEVEVTRDLPAKPFRMPVQYVIRPRHEDHHDFRGYAGRIASGVLHEGDEVVTLPSGRTSRVHKIYRYQTELPTAQARQSVTITLTDDVDISRGDVLAKVSGQPTLLSQFTAYICWLGNQPLASGKTYLIQAGTQRVKARMTAVNFVQDPASLLRNESDVMVKMNDLAQVQIKTAKPLPLDRYAENQTLGSFILLDEYTNGTVAVGFVE